jgi:hypothetical protein
MLPASAIVVSIYSVWGQLGVWHQVASETVELLFGEPI